MAVTCTNRLSLVLNGYPNITVTVSQLVLVQLPCASDLRRAG